MKITDEILNRYIDGELDKSDLEEFNAEMIENEDAMNKLKDMQMVNSALSKIETLRAPSNITVDVMKKILKKSDRFIKDKIFFRFVGVIFGILTTLLVVFGLSSSGSKSGESPLVEKSVSFMKSLVPDINFTIDTRYLLILSVSVSVILIAAVFYLYETHKQFNKKIKSL